MEPNMSLGRWVALAVALLLGGHLFSTWYIGTAMTSEMLLGDVTPPVALKEHSQGFNEPEIIPVVPGIYVALGFALGNSILIEAPEGAIIVDTTESQQAAEQILTAFREVTQKPVKAIIYTHNHRDHISGAKAFLVNTSDEVEIWAHRGILGELRVSSTLGSTAYTRAMRQFGVLLPKRVNYGNSSSSGFKLHFDGSRKSGYVKPNRFLDEEEADVVIAGLKLKLMHIPGETPDHMGVWLPQQRAFLCGDDLYKAFPNLYAIRGTSTRDVMKWVQTLDKIRNLLPDYLVPSHTRPVSGQEKVHTLLTQYRDAIQLVHDQTVRFLNRGMHPDEIVQHVNLPTQLKNHPYLKEFYGTVEWSVKGIFNSYIGWFSGDIAELSPLTNTERARRFMALVGRSGLLAAARQALDDGDSQWALELSSHVFRLNSEDEEARSLRLTALKAMAARQVSPNGRNYYLTVALEDHNVIRNRVPPTLRADTISSMPTETLLRALTLRFKAQECEEVDKVILFRFTDTQETFYLEIRHSIAVLRPGDESLKWDLKVTTRAQVWRDIIGQKVKPLYAYLFGDLVINGGVLQFRSIMTCFDRDE